jgi:tetratricopeptide (TPR) repeat protein
LGDAYRAVNGHNDALTSYRAALRLAKDSRDISNQFRALRGLVQSYSAVGQYPLAFQALNQHMALAQNEKNLSEQLFSLRLSGKLYKATGQLLNARYSYERAIALAGALGDTQEEALLRNDLAQIIYERGYR